MKGKPLLILLAVAAAWRLLFVCIWGPLSLPDSLAYHNLAQNILSGDGYVDTRPSQFLDASLIRTPGYPLFLAGLRFLFPRSDILLLLVQQLLGVLSVGLIYGIAVLLTDARTGFRAGLIAALHPWLAITGNTFMTETVFIFVFTLALWLLTVAIKKESPARLILSGLVFGVSLLVRPAFILFPFLLPVALGVSFKKLGKAAGFSALFAISSFAATLPWIAWNHAHKGYSGLAAFSGINLLALVQPPPSFFREQDAFHSALRSAYPAGREEVAPAAAPNVTGRLTITRVTIPYTYRAVKILREQGYSQPEIDRRFLRIAEAYILRHPFSYAKSAGREMLKLWSGYSLEWLGGGFAKRLYQNRRDGDRIVWAVKMLGRIGLGAILAALTILGAWKIVREDPSLLILLMIIASITLACGFFTTADLRYRLPAEPFIMLVILRGLRKSPVSATGH